MRKLTKEKHGTANLIWIFYSVQGLFIITENTFVGTSFVGKNYNYHRNNFSVDNGFGTLQIYAGFNFNLRKEYRKRNKSTDIRNRKLACLSKESLYICHVLTNKSKNQ